MVSEVHRSRVAGPTANQVRAKDILGALDARVAMERGCSQQGEFMSDGFRHLHYTGGCSGPDAPFLVYAMIEGLYNQNSRYSELK